MSRRLGPFECEIDELGPRGVGLGTAPDGRRVAIRTAAPGSLLSVVPTARSKGGWTARRLATLRPPPDASTPRCAQFGLCGGCVLQEIGLDAQRHHKTALMTREIAAYIALEGVTISEVRGDSAAYGYRNKIELSYGPTRWLSEADSDAGLTRDGHFLGFHPPGRFDRVVDCPRCELVSEEVNSVLARVREATLHPDAPPPYDPKTHKGFFRHLLVREAGNQRLVVLFTASGPEHEPLIERLAQTLSLELTGLASGVQWRINDGVADVARGDIARAWGSACVEEQLGAVRFQLSATSFFQTSTAGAKILYDTIDEALLGDEASVGEEAPAGGTLLDLYCGVGSIGLTLAQRFDRVVGVEENPESVEDAKQNAARNGITAEFYAGRVEKLLDRIAEGPDIHVVVDPPRAGLHPDVAARIARGHFGSLVYVACNPASLGRDGAIFAASGWRLTRLWPVDLFPQTGHIEVVGRFVRG